MPKLRYPRKMEPLSRNQKAPISFLKKDFIEYVDVKIRDLVQDFVKAGYLPISSCEGHSLFLPRYVVLAFTSIDTRNDFIKKIEKFKDQILFQEIETCTYEVINGVRYEYGTIANEIKGLNFIFAKQESFYCFLRITIGRGVSSDKEGEENIYKKIRFSFLLHKTAIYNFLFRESIMHRLSLLLKSSKTQP